MASRLVVALLLVTAGCTAVDVGSQSTPSARPVTSDRPATPTSVPTSTPPTTAVSSLGPTESNTVAYESLSPVQRRAFDRALDGQTQFVYESVLDSPYIGDEYYALRVAEPFRTHEYVRKNDTHYRPSYRESGGNGLATYGIEATSEKPPADADVVALENVPTRIRDPVRWAVENGSYSVPAGKWYSLPPEFERFDYVRFDGTHYRISIRYGDLFADALHAEPVA